MRKEKVRKGIILAAGDGGRLGSLTAICPKVLLPVNGKEQLIRCPIEALAAAGVIDIAVVVGYLGDKVIETPGNDDDFGVKLQYIYNSDYLGGNAISVYKAREWVQEEPVVLCMGDHVIDGEIVKRLLDKQVFNETLCVDYTPTHHHKLAEATKVVVDSAGCIRNIGQGHSFDTCDVSGCFWADIDTKEDLDMVRG